MHTRHAFVNLPHIKYGRWYRGFKSGMETVVIEVRLILCILDHRKDGYVSHHVSNDCSISAAGGGLSGGDLPITDFFSY